MNYAGEKTLQERRSPQTFIMENTMPLVATPIPGAAQDAEVAGKQPSSRQISSKKHAAKMKEDRQLIYEAFCHIRDSTKQNGLWNTFSEVDRDTILRYAVPPAQRTGGANGPSFFQQVFGNDPQVGAVVDLKTVLNSTLKGISEINKAIRDWAKKGTIVDLTMNKADALQSTLTLTAIGGAK
jgi:hypothetical protein